MVDNVMLGVKYEPKCLFSPVFSFTIFCSWLARWTRRRARQYQGYMSSVSMARFRVWPRWRPGWHLNAARNVADMCVLYSRLPRFTRARYQISGGWQ